MNRVTGGFMVVGGLAESGIGVLGAATTSPTVVGAVGFGALAAHGGLTTGSGLNRLITGEGTRTLTAHGLDYVTGNQTASDVIDALAGAAGSFGGTFALRQAAAGNYLFRGTSVGYEGTVGLQAAGITPTTTDPAVATLFATRGSSFGQGVVYIANRTGLPVAEGNWFAGAEREVGVQMLPAEFAAQADASLSAMQARAILNSMGIQVPEVISSQGNIGATLSDLTPLTIGQTGNFLSQAIPGFYTGYNLLGGTAIGGQAASVILSKH